MKAVAAVQRKTLVLVYTFWKIGTEYDPNHISKNTDKRKGQPDGTALSELA